MVVSSVIITSIICVTVLLLAAATLYTLKQYLVSDIEVAILEDSISALKVEIQELRDLTVVLQNRTSEGWNGA